MRILAIAFVVLILAVPAATAGDNLARKALRIAKRADTRATAALAAVPTPAKGDVGATGQRGLDGQNGAPGLPGVNGATGATGAQGETGDAGAVGPSGADGANGADGTGALSMRSATNAEPVRLAVEFYTERRTVVDLSIGADQPGQVAIIAEGQAESVWRNAGTPPAGTPVTCGLELDGASVATREFDLAAGASQLVSVTAAPAVQAGAHYAALVCNRSDGVTEALVEFGAERARLTVLGN